MTNVPALADASCRVVPADTGFGIIGDSNSDEYRADDQRGGPFAATTFSWVEQLVHRRGLNFGPWGTWGETRRSGYEYNWSRSGATTDDMIRSGQHTGLANQIAEGKVAYVIIFIGTNDFQMWNGAYAEIYNGTLSGASLDAKLDRIVNSLTVTVDTLGAAGDARMLMIGIPDLSQDAEVVGSHPEPEKRRRVSDAISSVNSRLSQVAAERHIPWLDVESYANDLFTRVEANKQLLIGNVAINVRTKGNDPRFLRLDDPVGHAGTVSMGLFANEFVIRPLRERYGLCIAPFTDQEILETAGLAGTP